MTTSKKITKVDGGSDSGDYKFTPSEENKSKATTYRVIAFVGWIIAIGLEAFAIFKLLNPLNMTWIIVTVIVAGALAITGNLLWKKANRLDPASKKNKFKFFVQSQLGAFMSALAFLPLLIMVLTNKDIDGKQKGILGGIVGVVLLAAVGTGIDSNPPSQEEYNEQTNQVEGLIGKNQVYWTKSGNSYHLFSSCHHINRDVTKEIFEGTVATARELKNITDLCNTCESKAIKQNNISEEGVLEETIDQVEKEEVLEGELAF